MATTLKDIRTVRIQLSLVELLNLLVGPATNAGFIDFTPDRIDINRDGTNTDTYEVVFEQDLP